MLRISVSLDVHLRKAEDGEGQAKKGVEGATRFPPFLFLVDWLAMRQWLSKVLVIVSLGNRYA